MNSLALVGYGFCVYPILVQHIYMHHVKGGGAVHQGGGMSAKNGEGGRLRVKIVVGGAGGWGYGKTVSGRWEPAHKN